MADQEFSADQLTPDYRRLASDAATAAGVPVDLVHRLIQTESNWNPGAVSSKGAIGLMQLMPDTARELGVDPTDPAANLEGGVRYLKSLLEKYHGDTRLATAAYNAGPGAVDRAGGVPNYPETQAYVAQVGDRGTQEFDASDLQPATTQEFDAADLQPLTPAQPTAVRTGIGQPLPAQPVQARGFTDPASVKVTPPVALTPPVPAAPPAPTRPSRWLPSFLSPPDDPAIQQQLEQQAINPLAQGEGAATPLPGVSQMKRGVQAIGQSLITPPQEPWVQQALEQQAQNPLTQGEGAATPLPTETKQGVSDTIEGFFKTTEPIVAGAMLTNPVVTAIGLGSAVAASKAASAAVTAAGGDAESARLAGNVAALAAGSKATEVFVRAGRAKVTELAADARAVRAQVEAFDRAHPEAESGGIKQAGSGATPTARTGNRLTEGQKALTAGPEEAEAPPVSIEPSPTEPTVPRAMESAAEAPAKGLPEWAREAIQQDTATAERLGIADRIEQLSAERLTAKEVAQRLRSDVPAEIDVVSLVRAVRATRGIPSMDAKSDFEEWLKSRGSTVEVSAEDLTPLEKPEVSGNEPAVSGKLSEPAPTSLDVRTRDDVSVQSNAGREEPEQPDVEVAAEDLVPAETSELKPADSNREPVEREYSSTQVNLPPEAADAVKALAAKIPDAALAKDGRETEPHLTVKFGIHTNEIDQVRAALADVQPFQVTLGRTSHFPDSGNGDVVKVGVSSPELRDLNRVLSKTLEHTDTHPGYVPHVTVAYVKPGLGKQYDGDRSLEGRVVNVDRIVFSAQDGTTHEIPLGRTTAEAGYNAGAPAHGEEPSGRGDTNGPATPGAGRQPQGRRATRRRPAEEADAPATHHEIVEGLIARATAPTTAGRFTGNPDHLRAELHDRLALLHELDAEFASSGQNPEVLLRQIVKYGGISLQNETGWKGELRWLREHGSTQRRGRPNPFGQFGGVQGVFNKDGLSLDSMVTELRQDQRFGHIETIEDLFSELRAAATRERHPAAIEDRFRKSLGPRWWEHIGQAGDLESADEGDISFDPAALEAETDILDTGEAQPRLPEAGAVRDVEHATPEFDVPFSLASEADTTPRASQRDLLTDNEERGGGAGETSSLPHTFTELPAPRGTTPPSTPPSAGARPSTITANLLKALGGVPLRTGRFQQRARGIYKNDVRAIRLRTAGDLRTIFHEAGHDFDIAVLRLDRNDVRWRDELLALGQATSMPSYPPPKQRKEGAAEFFVLYLTEPARAKELAPEYFAEVGRQLDAQPDLRDALQAVRKDIDQYLGLSYAERGRLRIDRSREPSVLARAARDPKEAMRSVARALVDDLQPLNQAVQQMRDGRPLAEHENAYVLARLARGAASKAEAFLEIGVRGRDGAFIGPALSTALTHDIDRTVLSDYLVALTARERLKKQGKNPGLTREEADAIIAETEARPDAAALRKAADTVHRYNDALLEYAGHYGGFNTDQLARIRELHEEYVPLQRVMDESDGFLSGVARRTANRTMPVKRFKGSGRDIVDPFESIIRNTFAIVDSVEKNKAMQALVTQAENAAGSAQWVERIPTPQVATRFNLAGLTRQIKGALDDAGVADVPDNLDEALDQFVTVFTPATFARGNEQIVTVLREGKREFWQVNHTPLYDAITAIGPRDTGLLLKWLQKPTQLLRAAATLTPGFITRNPVRDTLVAYLQSQYGFLPVVDTVRGLIAQLRGDADADLFFTSGIAQAAMQAQDRNARQRAVKRLGQHGLARARSIVMNPIDLLRAVGEWMEVSTRLGEFKLALDAGGAERGVLKRLLGGPRPPLSEEGLTRATLAARDVTTDFSRGGALSREINRFEAFFNARVQGYVRGAEAIRRDPFGILLKLGLLALFSAALWYENHDDPAYDELEEWEKHTYWHLKIGEGQWARIPKPFEWGYVPDLVEAGLQYASEGDPHRFQTIRSQLVGGNAKQTIVGLMPTTLLPLVEAVANYSAFRDRSIVPQWDTELPTELQYTEWTSETAKLLGKVIPIAPAQLDNLIYGYTAGFGRGVVSGVDAGLRTAGQAPEKNPPASPSQQYPVVGNFLRDRTFGASAQSIQDIHDLADAIHTVEQGARTELKHGEKEAATARFDAAKDDYAWQHRPQILGAARALKLIGREIRAIYAAPITKMSPDQKRDRLDREYERMTAIARRALGRSVADMPTAVNQ